MAIKRNATAVIPIEVGIPVDDIVSIEFLFKKEKNPSAPELLKKSFKKEDLSIPEGNSNENGFTMLLTLSPEETYRLEVGKVYMDTLAVLTDGTVPVIPIAEVDDVLQTLYSEVYKDGSEG